MRVWGGRGRRFFPGLHPTSNIFRCAVYRAPWAVYRGPCSLRPQLFYFCPKLPTPARLNWNQIFFSAGAPAMPGLSE